jgi:hypothetical protein
MKPFNRAKYSLLTLSTYEPEDFSDEVLEIANSISSKTPYDEHPMLNSNELAVLLREISEEIDDAILNRIAEKKLRLKIKQVLVETDLY